MHRLKVLGLTLVVLATASVLAATSASAALPEFKYTSKHLQISGGEAKFTMVDGLTIHCSKVTGEGELTGAKTASAKLTFTGCGANGVQCESTGAPLGEVKTGTLPVELVYLSKEKHEVGLVFNYEEPTHKFPPPPPLTFAQWECSGRGGGMRRAVIATVSPVNTKASSFSVTFSQKSTGVENPTFYEAETGEHINAFPELGIFGAYEEGSMTDSATLASEAFEISA